MVADLYVDLILPKEDALIIALAKDSGFSDSAKYPVFPSSTIRLIIGIQVVAAEGVPRYKASIKTLGNPSFLLESTKQSACFI